MAEELKDSELVIAEEFKKSDLTKELEFKIDVDFKKNKPIDLFPDENENCESEEEDILHNLEASTHKHLLSSPEYQSFDQLAGQMTDCGNGDVKLLILEEGEGPLIPDVAEVTLHYAAYFERVVVPFDTTLTMNQGQPIRMRLGEGKYIPGIEIGLTYVKGPQARFLLLLQPSVAWGEKGIVPRISPERVLFVITVYDVRHIFAAKRFNDLPQVEQAKHETTTQTVKDIREHAKTLFSRQKYHAAIKSYQQAISVINICHPENEHETQEINKLKLAISLNLAICYIKINKPKYVIKICENIDTLVDIDSHCKALFLKGKALEMLYRVSDAVLCYKKALKLEPKNKEIGKKLAELDEKNKNATEEEKCMWKKVFESNAEKKVTYDIDDVFKNSVLSMFEGLAGKDYARFDLPRLGKHEIEYIKDLAKDFSNIVVFEEGKGCKKDVIVVKKSS